MPEINLDEAFDTLTTEVGERTASRGAGAAISEARRRRTTIGAAAAVALIAVGGVVFSQLGQSDRISPAGELPAPAVLDAAALNSITDGWVSGWHEAAKADQAVLESTDNLFACLDNTPGGQSADVEPQRFGTQLMVGGGGQVAYLAFADFSDDTGAAVAAAGKIEPSFAGCAGNSGVTDAYGDRATVTSYDLRGDGSGMTETAWVARLDNRLSFSMVLADGRATDAQREDLGAALLGGLQVDESYRISDALQGEVVASGSGEASAGATVVAHPSFNQVLLADALAGWSSWAANGDATTPSLPCLTDSSPDGTTSGSSESVGSTGELSFYDFASGAEARAGQQQILMQLAACENGPWTIDSTTVPGAVVASDPHGVVWIAQQGSTIAMFTLADATDPPRSVELDVGKLVINAAG
jgi:hypothetical protein